MKDAIFEKETLYYRYGLSSLENIKEVMFYVTVIEGNIFLVGSTDDPFPSLDSNGTIKSSSSGRITFKKE